MGPAETAAAASPADPRRYHLGRHLSARRPPGVPIIINPSRVFVLSELAPYIQQYREAWHAAGHAGVPQVGLRVPVYVAKTAERAYEEPKVSTMAAVQNLGNRVADSASRVGTTGDWSVQAERVRRMSYEDWPRDKVVYGIPEAVVDRLQQLREELDLTQILCEVNYGRQIPYALQLENLRLINAHVMPQLK